MKFSNIKYQTIYNQEERKFHFPYDMWHFMCYVGLTCSQDQCLFDWTLCIVSLTSLFPDTSYSENIEINYLNEHYFCQAKVTIFLCLGESFIELRLTKIFVFLRSFKFGSCPFFISLMSLGTFRNKPNLFEQILRKISYFRQTSRTIYLKWRFCHISYYWK